MKFLAVVYFGFCMLAGARAQTNVVFPELLSSGNSVLMTNAEFRCLSGGKLCFRSGLSEYRSFEGAKLSPDVLAKLGFTLEDLHKRQELFNQKNKLASAAYAAQVAALAQRQQQLELEYEKNAARLAATASTNGASVSQPKAKSNGGSKRRY